MSVHEMDGDVGTNRTRGEFLTCGTAKDTSSKMVTDVAIVRGRKARVTLNCSTVLIKCAVSRLIRNHVTLKTARRFHQVPQSAGCPSCQPP